MIVRAYLERDDYQKVDYAILEVDDATSRLLLKIKFLVELGSSLFPYADIHDVRMGCMLKVTFMHGTPPGGVLNMGEFRIVDDSDLHEGYTTPRVEQFSIVASPYFLRVYRRYSSSDGRRFVTDAIPWEAIFSKVSIPKCEGHTFPDHTELEG